MQKQDDTRYDTCPKCGGRKRKVSKTCKLCQRLDHNGNARYVVDWDLVTDAWLSEFCGFFAGEGYAGIIRNNSSFSAILALRLRDDDVAAVFDIQEKLGGRLLYSKRKSEHHGDQVEWRTTNLSHAIEICELILERSVLPNKKLKDIEQVLDFARWRLSIGYHFSDEERQEAQRRLDKLRQSRKYQ